MNRDKEMNLAFALKAVAYMIILLHFWNDFSSARADAEKPLSLALTSLNCELADHSILPVEHGHHCCIKRKRVSLNAELVPG